MKMKNKVKKSISVIAALMMVLTMLLTACGGGSSSDSSSDAGAKDAEPNAGFKGIVYTIPDDWTVAEKSESYVRYKIPGTDFGMSASITTEDDIAKMKDSLPEELKSESLNEFFEKAYKASDEAKEKNRLDQTVVKICDSDAYYTKRANEEDSGYLTASAAWLYEGSLYELYMYNKKAFDNEGNPVEGAELMHEDMLETFEGVFATVKPGDGSKFAAEIETPSELGEISFEMPEGYTAYDISEEFLNFKKEGSEAVIRINRMTEEDVKNVEQDGKKLSSLQEYYGMNDVADEDKTTIAGVEGHVFKYPDEDGKIYHCNAAFMTDQAVYEINIDTNPYDENGLKPDAVPLTDEEIAEFDALVQSIKMK